MKKERKIYTIVDENRIPYLGVVLEPYADSACLGAHYAVGVVFYSKHEALEYCPLQCKVVECRFTLKKK